ncbi:MAG TPA: tetratricopeptide repeat protein [Thermoanaerobaculia bacterium]|nr:tetratricopeptide repeat protein [Thermoanaerobaculia bacterium]
MNRTAFAALALHALLSGAAAGAGTAEDDLARARHALKRGDVAHAVEAAERAARAEPSSSEAHHWLGKAYGLAAKEASLVTQLSFAKKCRAELARAVELDPANLAAALDLVRYYARAPRLLGGGRDKARALASEIEERNRARGTLALGVILESEKNPIGAERAYRVALAADPKDDEVLSALADLLTSQKRPEAAYDVCRAAAERSPEDPRPWFEIGLLSARTGREIPRGLAALERFVALPSAGEGPDLADGRYRRGELLALAGDVDGARAELAQALALEPGHAGAGATLARLEAHERERASGAAASGHAVR